MAGGIVGPEDVVDRVHADDFVAEVHLVFAFEGVAVAFAFVYNQALEAAGVVLLIWQQNYQNIR